jgi:putative endonuclease
VSSDTPPAPNPAPFYVYILQCSDGSYYVGYARDPEERLQRHNKGRGSAWTRRRLPVRLAYSEPAPDEPAAMAREAQLKRWSAAKKAALINSDPANLKQFSRCRSRWGQAAITSLTRATVPPGVVAACAYLPGDRNATAEAHPSRGNENCPVE